MNCILDLFYRSREHEWEDREIAYIRELKKANDRTEEFVKQTGELQDHYRQEQARWHMKEDDYIEQINELQNELHQKDVVTQQYKIYEENFQQDRQQLSEIQGLIEELRRKTETQAREIDKLTAENKKYLETVIRLQEEISGDVDLSKVRRISSGYGPHVTGSILV